MVGQLRNAIQVVNNTFEEEMSDINRELYTLQIYRTRLLEDKSNPLMSQAKIQKKIDENQAEITPLKADAETLKTVKEEFKLEAEVLCDKTVVRAKTRDRGPKVKF